MTIPTMYKEYAEKIKQTLPSIINKIPDLSTMINLIIENGGVPYLVGGTARDIVYDAYMNKHISMPKDIDIEVFGIEQNKLEEILNLRLTGKEFPVYNTTIFHELHTIYDVQYSLPRHERKIGLGHSEFATSVDPNMQPFVAAQRRDMTINSIMINLTDYSILDWYNGINDLLFEKRASYVISDTFIEDPLRVLRVARFIAKYNLIPTQGIIINSKGMIKEYQYLTPELREKELSKIFRGKRPHLAIDFLQRVGWLEKIYPDGDYENIFSLLFAYKDWDVSKMVVRGREGYPMDHEALAFALILHEKTDKEIEAWFKSINPNWEKATIFATKQIVKFGNELIANAYKWDVYYLARYLKYNCYKWSGEIAIYISIFMGENFFDQMYDVLNRWVIHETFPIIYGDDCLEYIPEGELIGKVCKFFRENHINGLITNREIALKILPSVIDLVKVE